MSEENQQDGNEKKEVPVDEVASVAIALAVTALRETKALRAYLHETGVSVDQERFEELLREQEQEDLRRQEDNAVGALFQSLVTALDREES